MGAENPVTETDLKPAPAPPPEDPWAAISGLSCQLSVAVNVTGFKVRDLLALDVETVIESQNNATGAVPVWINGAKIARAEFDVLGTRLAIRISDLE
ncbi:MAG: FliM/FliN family flagellar motor switch protein [Terriglobia bacterium]